MVIPAAQFRHDYITAAGYRSPLLSAAAPGRGTIVADLLF